MVTTHIDCWQIFYKKKKKEQTCTSTFIKMKEHLVSMFIHFMNTTFSFFFTSLFVLACSLAIWKKSLSSCISIHYIMFPSTPIYFDSDVITHRLFSIYFNEVFYHYYYYYYYYYYYCYYFIFFFFKIFLSLFQKRL